MNTKHEIAARLRAGLDVPVPMDLPAVLQNRHLFAAALPEEPRRRGWPKGLVSATAALALAVSVTVAGVAGGGPAGEAHAATAASSLRGVVAPGIRGTTVPQGAAHDTTRRADEAAGPGDTAAPSAGAPVVTQTVL